MTTFDTPTIATATHLRDDRYAVRPQNQLGTHGFYPVPWSVIYVRAWSEREAVKAAIRAARRYKVPDYDWILDAKPN